MSNALVDASDRHVVSARVEAEVASAIYRLADEQERSVSAVIRRLLRESLGLEIARKLRL